MGLQNFNIIIKNIYKDKILKINKIIQEKIM